MSRKRESARGGSLGAVEGESRGVITLFTDFAENGDVVEEE